MADLLDLALRPESVNRAWKRVRNDRAPWLPGMEPEELHYNLPRYLLELIEELRNGRYRPHGLRQFPTHKADGRIRVLSALTLRDKLAQRMVLNAVEPIGEGLFHNDSYGYRPRRNVEMAHAKAAERIACGLDWLVDADIESFFDRIHHRPLRVLIKKQIPDRRVVELMYAWLEAETLHNGLFDGRRGVPQGAVLSPFWCNLYLHGFDLALAGKGIPFVRFADDFLLFAAGEAGARRAYEFAGKELERLGLRLHPRKSRVVRAEKGVVFLGQPLPEPASGVHQNG